MTNYLFDYDENNIESILNYSKHLLDKPLSQIIDEYGQSPYKTREDFQSKNISEVIDKEISIKSKGQYGNYIEKYFYGYQPNSDSAADFEKIWMTFTKLTYGQNVLKFYSYSIMA